MKIFGIANFVEGKTALIEQLISLLRAQGLKVAVLKQTHASFDMDKPGKDSWRHRAVGAREVMVVSPQRWVLMHELRQEKAASLTELIARLSPCDVVLLEGFDSSSLPQINLNDALPSLHAFVLATLAGEASL